METYQLATVQQIFYQPDIAIVEVIGNPGCQRLQASLPLGSLHRHWAKVGQDGVQARVGLGHVPLENFSYVPRKYNRSNIETHTN